MTTPVGAFLLALEQAGLAMHEPMAIADGSLHRYQVDGDKSGSRNGWYVLHLDEKPFGAFGSWKTGQSLTWTAGKPESMTAAERLALTQRMAATRREQAAEQARVHADAASRAAHLWERAKPADNAYPYLARKQVAAFGVRDLRGQLVVPMRDADGRLWSLQFIAADGRKTFLTGGRKRSCYHAIGRPAAALCICEGYATGATIYQTTGHATAVAFDAGNLLPVAEALRAKFPQLALVIAGDNDTETPGNPGLTAATAAARAVGAVVALPQFGRDAHV
ncbi:toprim domain-containing protein [Azonexus sp.]|jgi:putative DNA primase/helicase|uniref:toprim domain-containing protein n=1 Tax=Azonexus sp. TaxID=1872668 RepID=UPI0035D51724